MKRVHLLVGLVFCVCVCACGGSDSSNASPPPEGDAGAEDTQGEVQDATGENQDTVEPDTEGEPPDAVGDAQEVGGDTAAQDADNSADSGPIEAEMGCQVGDVWTIDIASEAAPGMGCQTGGGQAQDDATQVFEVVETDGGLSLSLLEPDGALLDHLEISASLTSDAQGCSLRGALEIGLTFPPDNNNDFETQARLRYTYALVATQGVAEGNGEVLIRFVRLPDAEDLNPPCTEPLTVSAGIERPD